MGITPGAAEHVTLRDYIDTVCEDQRRATDALEKRLVQRFDAMQLAIVKAEVSMDARVALLNELRGALMDAQALFATRAALEAAISMLGGADNEIRNQIHLLRIDAATLAGKASQSSVFLSGLLGALGLLIGAIGLAMRIAGR